MGPQCSLGALSAGHGGLAPRLNASSLELTDAITPLRLPLAAGLLMSAHGNRHVWTKNLPRRRCHCIGQLSGKMGDGAQSSIEAVFSSLHRHKEKGSAMCLALLGLLSGCSLSGGLDRIRKLEAGSAAEQHLAISEGLFRRWTVLIGSTAAALLVAGSLLTVPLVHPSPAGALTEENVVFLEAWRVVDRAYVDKSFNGQNWFRYRQDTLKNAPMKNRQETYEAIRKMLGTLGDPFTRFLEPEKLQALRAGTNGALTGVGLEVGFTGNGGGDLVVVAPVSGGPADRAGVEPGDIIRAIDATSTNGMGLYEAAQRLQGPSQTAVELTVERKGDGFDPSLISLTVMREKINLNPVSWSMCGGMDGKPSVGYIRLSTFNQNSAGAVREAVQRLRADGASAFVLDIRNNSGGLFPVGVEIAKMWLKDGVVVYIADSMGVRDIYDTDGSRAISTEEPLTVLVNKGTASASEILAGALKDNKRAVILGEPTFGKGKIQSVFELSDGSGLAVTIARYETPAHIDIDKVGITPDGPLPEALPIGPAGFCACFGSGEDGCSLQPSLLFAKK